MTATHAATLLAKLFCTPGPKRKTTVLIVDEVRRGILHSLSYGIIRGKKRLWRMEKVCVFRVYHIWPKTSREDTLIVPLSLI